MCNVAIYYDVMMMSCYSGDVDQLSVVKSYQLLCSRY